MQNPITTELTDLSNLPADRVKPQDEKIEQSGSQASTMQSVSLNEVNGEGIREQMPQGSLENLNAEPSLLSQGVEVVKKMADKAVRQIEDFVNTAADQLTEMGREFNAELTKDAKMVEQALKEEANLWQAEISKDVKLVKEALKEGAADLKAEINKDVQGIQQAFRDEAEGHAFQNEASHGMHELKEGAVKRAYLVRRSVSRRLGKRGEKIQKQAGLAAGVAKVYAKEEYKYLRRKAQRYGRNLNKDARLAERSLEEEGDSLEAKARRFQEDFERSGSIIGAQLREGARSFRRQARRLLNDLPRQAELTKQSIKKQAGEIKSELQSKPTGNFSDASPSKFLLEFSANEMNGRNDKPRTQSARPSGLEGDFQGKSSQWSMEISAHDWNESASTANKYIGFLMDKAQDYLKRASRQSHYAQRRFNRGTRNFKRSAEGLLQKGKQAL